MFLGRLQTRAYFMKEVKLTNGGVALVSDQDLDRVNTLKWYKRKTRNTWYVACTSVPDGFDYQPLMHHFIIGKPEDSTIVVDHIDSDGLNNQRENLRFISNSENVRRGDWIPGKSGARGVYFIKRLKSKPYRAEVRLPDKTHNLGYYATLDEAVEARESFLADYYA
jgi:HNH endonuclease